MTSTILPGIRPRVITVFTRVRPGETDAALKQLIEVVVPLGLTVKLPPEESERHGLDEREGVVQNAEADGETDVAVVLGGDGTILRALRTFAGHDVPVFSFNYGAIGFLSTVDHGEFEDGVRRVVTGDFQTRSMPALAIETEDGARYGVNDVSFHRSPEGRVAELGYSVRGERLGAVRCDGLVAATPVGSTGYNLANGGPILAWGVEGFVVSFIAPHTLTARALVVAPDDGLTVTNLSREDSVDVTTDGRMVACLEPGAETEIRFQPEQVHIAQLPGASFYHQLQEKFGRLAS